MGGRKFLPWVQRIAALGAFLVLSLSSAQATDPSAVIAHIGKTEIHASEIQPLVAVLDPQAQAALAQDPTKLQQFVRSALVQRMLLQEALAKKWDQQPAVQEQLRQARENKLVDTYVQAIAKVPDVYPDEAEIQSAYDQAKDSLLAPRQYRLAQIFVAAPKITDPIQLNLAQSRMESLQKELQKPNADFAALATARSEDMASAVHGGEIGWLTENQVQPDMRSQFTSLRKGTTSPPIRLLDGWHFLKCMDIKEPYTLSLAEVKSQLIQELRTQRARAIAKDYVDNLVQSAPLTIDEASVRKVLKP
jgi:parvulin-like peptidyl-prolyl isomerase